MPTSKHGNNRPAVYLVATPIGNLGDISLRALWVLSNVDVLLCEDTRVTGGLLAAFGIKKKMISCHDHNEYERAKLVISLLGEGKTLALVSDAGTPLISDPGYRLSQRVRKAGFDIIAIPGASALLTALASAGLPTDHFFFAGFLPNKSVARKKKLAELKPVPGTLVFYEAPSRVAATLNDLATVFSPRRQACLARELTKRFEALRVSTLGELSAQMDDEPIPKGEFVILLGPAEEEEGAAFDLDQALMTTLKNQSLRDAVAFVVQESGLKKSEVYARALQLAETLGDP